MKKIKVSIIIPTFRPQDYFLECLLSIKNQTIGKNYFQIIIILNGEKYPYFDSIKNYIETILEDFNVELYFTEEIGVSNARNIGLEKALGEYIAFIDDDDCISPSYLEELLKTAEQGFMPVANVLNYYETTDESYETFLSKRFRKNYNIVQKSHFRMRSYLSSVWANLIKRDLIQNITFNRRFFNGEDALFMFQLSSRLPAIKTSAKTAVYYVRIRNNSLSRTKKSFSKNFYQYVLLLYEYCKIYFTSPSQYSLLVFLSRIIAVCIHILRGI
jgi:glycosyltransferase involved in cell wall biosynthesis